MEGREKWLSALDFESSLKSNINIAHVTAHASFRADCHHLEESPQAQVNSCRADLEPSPISVNQRYLPPAPLIQSEGCC
jgi:hypothetical protein